MKKIILILSFLFLFSLVSANTCEDVYYTIVEYNWNINESYFEQYYNISNFSEFIDKYPENCQAKYGLDSLPKKPEIPQIIIYKNQTDCNYKLSPFWGVSLPIPKFFQIYLGEQECSKIKFLKYLFRLDNANSYTINGVRVYSLLFLGLFLFCLWFISSNSRLNNLIDKFKSKENFTRE